MRPSDLPFSTHHAGRPARLGRVRPDLRRRRRQPHDGRRGARPRDARRADRDHRGPDGIRRLRAGAFPHPKGDAPGILVLGHMDTVHPVGTLDVLPGAGRHEMLRARIVDMKGGNYLAVEAIRQLMRAGVATPLPVTVLFTSDEEVGSPSTRDLIEAPSAAPLRAGARAVPAERQRGERALPRSRAISNRSDGRAMRARASPTGARRSAPWRVGSSRSSR